MDKLALIQQQFAANLTKRLESMSGILAELLATGWREEPAREFHRAAHNLTGSGTTFGYPAVSAAAFRLELAIHDLLNADGPDMTDIEQLQGLMDAVVQAAAAGQSPTAKSYFDRKNGKGTGKVE